MLLPFQGVGMAACVFPRVSLRLPWAMCWLGFQPDLWLGGCGIRAWVRASDVRIFRVVALLCFCPFRAQDWRRASFPGCRFACPGLCAGWAFSPTCGSGVAGLGHGCGHRTCVFSVLSLCYAFALSGRRIGGVRLSQGVASLALGYVLVGLSARLVVRGLRDGGMGAGIGCAYFPCCRFVMLLHFQGAGLAAYVSPRVSLRLPWTMCWLGFQPALWCGGCGMGHGCGHRTCKEKSSPPVLFAGWGGLSCRCPRLWDGGLTCP